MSDPLDVDVVIATRSGRKSIVRAVRSVVAQVNVNIRKLVIVENNSNDFFETANILSEAGLYDLDYLNHVYLLECANANVARNFGAFLSDSPYIAFLDSDDEYLPEHLWNSIDTMSSQYGDICFSNFKIVQGRNEYVLQGRYSGDIERDLFIDKCCDFRTSGIVTSRTVFMDTPFDEALFKHQDWGFALDHSKKGSRLCLLSKPSFIVHLDSNDRMSGKTNQAASIYFAKEKLTYSRAHFIQSRIVDEIFANNHKGVVKYFGSGYYCGEFAGFKKVVNMLVTLAYYSPFFMTSVAAVIRFYRRFFVSNK